MPDVQVEHMYGVRLEADGGGDGDGGDGLTWFTAVTNKPNRNGSAVDPMGLDTDNFEKNPIFAWAHGTGGGFMADTPELGNMLGRVEKLSKTAESLEIGVKFGTHENGKLAADLVEQKILNAVSIGFMPDYDKSSVVDGVMLYAEAELLEVSLVPIPADAGALRMVQSALGTMAKKEADVADTPEDRDKAGTSTPVADPKEPKLQLVTPDEAKAQANAEREAEREAERARVMGIRQICKLANKQELALDFIADGKTLAEVQEDLVNQMADDDDAGDDEPDNKRETDDDRKERPNFAPRRVYETWGKRYQAR